MIRLDKMYKPIQDKELPSLHPLLQSLQGNILRGHGRDRSIHLFLHFKTSKVGEVKEKLRTFADRVTSAQQQHEEAEEYRRYNIPGNLFCNFFLAAAGYRYLGLDLTGYNKAFIDGMKGARKRLLDPPVETWEEGYQQEIHAMILLADNDKDFLLREARKLLDEMKEVADIGAVEHGKVMRNEHGHHIEHFGYVDGRSQPRFFQREVDKEKQEMDGTDRWDPSAGPTLVIVKEPTGHALDFGSYVVFRKLEQNVRGFKEREKLLASTLGLTGDDEERAGALVIGRFEDGTPVLLQRQEGMHAPIPNNFTFAEDPEGQKCPLHAHIRKVNPRGEFSASELRHRIARRGIPYGEREKEPKDDPSLDELPTAGVGLLFMCYQRDIVNQFEFLQAEFANDANFLRPATGIDPIIGHSDKTPPLPQQWPAQWPAPREAHRPFSFYGFVTLKGGEYFFAPSRHFLRCI